MKIGILHRDDVRDVKKLSGTPFYMTEALKRQGHEIVYLGPDQSLLTRWIELGGRVFSQLSLRITGKRISSDHHRLLSWRLASQMDKRLIGKPCDVIFAPMAAAELAYLKSGLPVIYLSDLTWARIIEYYPGASNLYRWVIAEGDRIEGAAIRRADGLIFPSEWAADSAKEDYGAAPERVWVIPFGANFPKDDLPTRAAALSRKLTDEVRLLWVGVNWARKGGEIAYDCLMQLLSTGVNARLTVCGCIPPPQFKHERIEVIPFLDKRIVEQRHRLSSIYMQAHFLLFPTIAEATPIVVCEASAHGLPSLVSGTGGTAGVVKDARNGFLLPADADGFAYAAKVIDFVASPEAYEALVKTSRGEYEERLNWDSWAIEVGRIFANVIHTEPTHLGDLKTKVSA